MRNTLVFAGSSCPALAAKICKNLGTETAEAELTQFSNGETSVRILTSVREKDVFVVQSGSPTINDTIMELLIMISACKGGSANKITAVLPYFPYSRQSKKKSHRGAITARMLANLLDVAGVRHVITVDLHASQMQGFFKCPVDNLHAEPIMARWIRNNVPNWKEAVVVSKNAGGTKRVTSLADALKLNFGMVTTDRRRGSVVNNLSASMIMNHMDSIQTPHVVEVMGQSTRHGPTQHEGIVSGAALQRLPTSRNPVEFQGPTGRPQNGMAGLANRPSPRATRDQANMPTLPASSTVDMLSQDSEADEGPEYNDQRASDVTHGRLVQGHIVPDDFPSPTSSAAETTIPDEDQMSMSQTSSFMPSEPHALGGSGDAGASSDEEDEMLKNPTVEHMITLVGDVKNRTVLIVDDMIDKPGSWIAAAETVVKRGHANKVYCIATHAVFGADCLEQLQACDCIDAIVVTNSYPIREDKMRSATKLVVLDLSVLLGEAIRRNHYGESISPLFQHITD